MAHFPPLLPNNLFRKDWFLEVALCLHLPGIAQHHHTFGKAPSYVPYRAKAPTEEQEVEGVLFSMCKQAKISGV